MQFYLKSIEDSVAQVKSQTGGLTAAEAEARLASNGKNKLKRILCSRDSWPSWLTR